MTRGISEDFGSNARRAHKLTERSADTNDLPRNICHILNVHYCPRLCVPLILHYPFAFFALMKKLCLYVAKESASEAQQRSLSRGYETHSPVHSMSQTQTVLTNISPSGASSSAFLISMPSASHSHSIPPDQLSRKDKSPQDSDTHTPIYHYAVLWSRYEQECAESYIIRVNGNEDILCQLERLLIADRQSDPEIVDLAWRWLASSDQPCGSLRQAYQLLDTHASDCTVVDAVIDSNKFSSAVSRNEAVSVILLNLIKWTVETVSETLLQTGNSSATPSTVSRSISSLRKSSPFITPEWSDVLCYNMCSFLTLCDLNALIQCCRKSYDRLAAVGKKMAEEPIESPLRYRHFNELRRWSHRHVAYDLFPASSWLRLIDFPVPSLTINNDASQIFSTSPLCYWVTAISIPVEVAGDLSRLAPFYAATSVQLFSFGGRWDEQAFVKNFSHRLTHLHISTSDPISIEFLFFFRKLTHLDFGVVCVAFGSNPCMDLTPFFTGPWNRLSDLQSLSLSLWADTLPAQFLGSISNVLSQLPSLTHFSLPHCQISREFLSAMSALAVSPSRPLLLKEVHSACNDRSIVHSGFNHDFTRMLSLFSSLTSVRMLVVPFEAAYLNPLTQLPRLQILHLGHDSKNFPQQSAWTIAPLSGCASLTELRLMINKFTPQLNLELRTILIRLADRLQALELLGTEIDLLNISSSASLQCLVVGHRRSGRSLFTREALHSLLALRHLRSLTFVRCEPRDEINALPFDRKRLIDFRVLEGIDGMR